MGFRLSGALFETPSVFVYRALIRIYCVLSCPMRTLVDGWVKSLGMRVSGLWFGDQGLGACPRIMIRTSQY